MSFVAAVHRLVRQIPRGRVLTYGQVATRLGRPGAARAVGWAMKRCPPGVPWHRVVNAAGGISLRANVGGMLTQRLLLEREGVALRGGRVPLRAVSWSPLPDRARRPPGRPRSSRARVEPEQGEGRTRMAAVGRGMCRCGSR